MAAVLGISAHYHDAAAALLVDGHLVAAIQQERLSRIKNDPALPLEAARACLTRADLDAADLDAVVFYEDPYAKLERVMVSLMRHVPRTWRQFPRAMASQLGDKLWVLDELAAGLGVPRKRIRFENHHRCHAASTYYLSPFRDAAVLVLDGVGEHSSTTLWHGHGDDLDLRNSIEFPHSLGLFYAAITAYLGFRVNEGEYKVMGLSAWGRPLMRSAFDRLLRIAPDGSYELGLDYFAHMTDAELGFGPALEDLLGPRRDPSRPWNLDTPEDQHYADVAATAQQVVEEAMLGLAHRAQALTGSPALCMAGGVALNAVANARLRDEGPFGGIFVQPAAGDAGGALGAAVLGALALGDTRPRPMTGAALGLEVEADRAQAVGQALGLRVERLGNPAQTIARRIADGDIVAHAAGRFEWGPRALGQRSILASPRRRETRERINRIIKHREPFRPFAPAVLDTATPTWFETEPCTMTPFMTVVADVRPEHRSRLQAVTHRDGTARLQTVSASGAPELHAILTEVGYETGTPMVLNTSLNGPGEPIVASAEDAIAFLLRHPVDALVVEDVLITRGGAR